LSIDEYRYRIQPVKGYWFTSFLVKELSNRTGCFETTLDLGLTRTTICLKNRVLSIGGKEINITDVTPSENHRVVLYDIETGAVYEVLRYTESGFYKLKAIALDKAPTLEINGIHMHRITGTDPWKDTLAKIRAAGISRGSIVLDTCMGLGYTSIASIIRGAFEVYTFEIDGNVLWVAERNPWSNRLSSDLIRIYRRDVTQLIHKFPDSFFHRVIHDPPRFMKSTGDLYSLDFYRELHRVLKQRGVLFHYTGEPGKHSNFSVVRGVKERLEKAGFKVLGFDGDSQGYIALKVS